MKDMTRRNFLKLSGAAALAVSAGALTACSGGGGTSGTSPSVPLTEVQLVRNDVGKWKGTYSDFSIEIYGFGRITEGNVFRYIVDIKSKKEIEIPTKNFALFLDGKEASSYKFQRFQGGNQFENVKENTIKVEADDKRSIIVFGSGIEKETGLLKAAVTLNRYKIIASIEF